jgi:hypothetical protein
MVVSTDMSEVRCRTCIVRRYFMQEDLHNRASQGCDVIARDR